MKLIAYQPNHSCMCFMITCVWMCACVSVCMCACHMFQFVPVRFYSACVCVNNLILSFKVNGDTSRENVLILPHYTNYISILYRK